MRGKQYFDMYWLMKIIHIEAIKASGLYCFYMPEMNLNPIHLRCVIKLICEYFCKVMLLFFFFLNNNLKHWFDNNNHDCNYNNLLFKLCKYKTFKKNTIRIVSSYKFH